MFNLNVYNRLRATRDFGARPVILEEINSTNEWIAGKFDDPDICRIVAVAHKQTAGKGRRGRTWFNITGKNLAFSLAWRVSESPGVNALVTLAAGVALVEAIMETTDAKPALKYPNDLLLGGKKVAGILSEMKTSPDGARFVIIGVGVNVNATHDQFPDEIRDIATSIREVCGVTASREAILALFLNNFEKMTDGMTESGPDDVICRFKKYTDMFGRKARVTGAGSNLVGVVKDMNSDGALVIEVAPGDIRNIVSGEITFLD